MKTLLTTLLALALSLSLSHYAVAHDDLWFDSQTHPHGGQMRMAGPFHVELVTASGELTAYVSDHADQSIATEGGTARATIMSGGKRSNVRLSAAGDNRLHGTGEFAMDEQMTVVLILSMPNHEPQQARFTPFQRVTGQAEHTHDHQHNHGDHAHHH